MWWSCTACGWPHLPTPENSPGHWEPQLSSDCSALPKFRFLPKGLKAWGGGLQDPQLLNKPSSGDKSVQCIDETEQHLWTHQKRFL